MNTLKQLTNVEKARLLHQLFRDEIPNILDFIIEFGTAIKNNEQEHRTNWDNGFFHFDFWLELLNKAEQVVKQYKKPIVRNSRLFADQLFDGYLAIYTTQALRVFIGKKRHADPKFQTAVDLFFNL